MEEFLLKSIAAGGTTAAILGGVIFFIGRRLLRLEDRIDSAFQRFSDTLNRFSESLDRHSKMELVRLVASPHVSGEVKDSVTSQLKEIERADEGRKK